MGVLLKLKTIIQEMQIVKVTNLQTFMLLMEAKLTIAIRLRNYWIPIAVIKIIMTSVKAPRIKINSFGCMIEIYHHLNAQMTPLIPVRGQSVLNRINYKQIG